MRAIRVTMTIPPVMRDIAAMLAFVDRQDAVLPGPVDCHGYCMSGPYALAAAAQEGVTAGGQASAPAQAGARRPAQRHGDVDQPLGESLFPPSPSFLDNHVRRANMATPDSVG